jgi:hypothetical protein
MRYDRQPSAGLFAGVDEAICGVFVLKDGRHLRQRKTCLEVASRPVAAEKLIELVRQLYRRVGDNLGERKPSPKNWRWKPQVRIQDRNKSPEVVLERAVALLAERGCLDKWCNQIPVASGLVDHKLDKRAAVDLARIEGDRLHLYELKWKSDTPIHAAFGILRYGLAYLLCRVNRTKLGYTDFDTMKVSALGLNVVAPLRYYDGFDLSWLQAGLDAGIRTVAQELEPDFRASFRFLALPDELSAEPTGLFASGAEARAACGATPLAPSAVALVQAMGKLTPVWPLPNSV